MLYNNVYANNSINILALLLFFTSDPDLGVWPDSWVPWPPFLLGRGRVAPPPHSIFIKNNKIQELELVQMLLVVNLNLILF